MSKQLVLQGEIVKKHNTFIRSPLRELDGAIGQKILACLIAQIKKDDVDLEQYYSIQVKAFLPSGGSSYQKAKGISEKMVKSFVEVQGEKKTHLFTLFREISYNNGVVEARFNKDLQPFLINLQEHFTQINLFEFLLLTSDYSRRLFEILKSWHKIQSGFVILSLEELHSQLNTTTSHKKNFKEFRTWVLDKAQKEILAKTDFFFEYETIKKGFGKTSPVVSIKFLFSEKKALPVALEKKKTDEEKKAQKQKLFNRAFYCAEKKKGNCTEKTEPAYVCKFCAKSRFCEQVTRSQRSNSLLTGA